MSKPRIVVCMGSEAQAHRVCRMACDMAIRSHAHLIGVNTACQPSNRAMATGSTYMMPANPSEAQESVPDTQSALVENSFRATVNDELDDFEWENVDDSADDAAQCLVRVARHADLVIMVQSDPTRDSSTQMNLLHEFAETACCPVLVVPANSDNDISESPALANLGVLPDF